MGKKIVVIGAGAAGSAAARRLSDTPEAEVLLLEAGGSSRVAEIQSPQVWPLLLGSSYDYGYLSTPQRSAGERVYPVPRGKALGGTTIMNAMIHAHPLQDEVRSWGLRISAEDRARILDTIDGNEGLVATRQGVDPHPMCQAFIDASLQAGHPKSGGLNTTSARGAGWMELSIDENGERVDAYDAYLANVVDRSNLTIWTGATVTSLVVSDGLVKAVQGLRDGEPFEITDADEVVLCAGAIDSPVLLLRSGLGPADDLAEIGIASVTDLPGVGKNLHDHPMVPIVWKSEVPQEAPANQMFESYLLLRDEARAAGQTLSVAFGHIPFILPGLDMPEFGASALIGQYSPRSRGSLRLASADPLAPPMIDPNYLSDDVDVQALTGGIEIVREIAAQPALSAFSLTEIAPGPVVVDASGLAEFVRSSSSSYFHPAGSCAAGGPSPVVDDHLRVIGVDNLRVADTSVLLQIPAAATSVTAQLIGWRAAELIVGD